MILEYFLEAMFKGALYFVEFAFGKVVRFVL